MSRAKFEWFRRAAACALGIVVMVAASAVPASAASPGPPAPTTVGASPSLSWAISPVGSAPGSSTPRANFQFVGRDGAGFTDHFQVVNRSDSTLTFNLYSADAYNTRVGGAFALKLANQHQDDVGSWVTLPTDKLTLPSLTKATVTYTVRIPTNAYPGDHAGGIVAQDAAPTVSKHGAIAVPVLTGIGVRIYVRVVGPLHPALAVSNAQITDSYPAFAWLTGSGRGRVSFDIANTGNTRLNVIASVKATNLFGSTVKTYRKISVPALLPGSVSFITEPGMSLPHFGAIKYQIALSANGARATGGVQAWLIPWVLLIIVLIAVNALVIVIARRRRRKKSPPSDGGSATEPRSPAPTPEVVGSR